MYKTDRQKGLSNVEICNIMENEENSRGVFAIDIILKKNRKEESDRINFQPSNSYVLH